MRDEIEQEPRALYETFAGVSLEIVKVTNSSLYQIVMAKGGVLDGELDGMFTTPQKAKEVIDDYNKRGLQTVANKEQKAKDVEAATEALLAAEPTKENAVKQRIAELKKENKAASA